VQPLLKAIWTSLKKLKTELPYNPVIPFLGIYPKECIPGYDRISCKPKFIAPLFTIFNLLKQPRCPTLMNELRRCGIYTQWSLIHSQRRMTLCLQVNGWKWGTSCLNKVNQAKKNQRLHIFSHIWKLDL
jgi:hypothetical protein